MLFKSRLPVLTAFINAMQRSTLSKMQNVLFVCVQHLLYTSIDLFEALIELGAKPNNIFLIGKHYSTCPTVVKRMDELGIQLQKLTPLNDLGEYTPIFNQDVSNMWQRAQQYVIENHAIETVVVLDDGGRCLEFITQGIKKELPVIGIEQTTAGLFNPAIINLHVPFIDVAACAAKIHLESDMIVESILANLVRILPVEKVGLRCGVVGIGVIGKAVVRQLLSLGCNLLVFDQNKDNYKNVNNAMICPELNELIRQSDYIFGCTGRDIAKDIDIENAISGNKFFISCSSEDKEFLTLLKFIQSSNNNKIKFDPLKDIQWQLPNGATMTLVKGGFPVNFDNKGESVPANKIQLTRGLLLAALIQAIEDLPYLEKVGIKGRTMLHPEAQRFVVQHWFQANANHSFSQQLIANFNDTEWIAANSGGVFYESDFTRNFIKE